MDAITRRRFLSRAAMCASYPLLGLSGFLIPQSHATPIARPYTFADLDGLGPELYATTIEQACCALHPEKGVPDFKLNPGQQKSMLAALKEEFTRAGLEWDPNNRIAFTFQHYGVPDNSAYIDELITYCTQANQFLYNRLNCLLEADVQWQHLSHDESRLTREQAGFQGYVGRFTYYVLRAVINSETADEESPCLVTAWPLERAINHVDTQAGYKPRTGLLYIIPGTTSLLAPFSELLHLSLHAASQRYADELSERMPKAEARQHARTAGETANEAAAFLIASEYLSHQRCNERVAGITQVTQSMARKFPALPKAITYIKRKGIEASLHLFQDNPAEFMRRTLNS